MIQQEESETDAPFGLKDDDSWEDLGELKELPEFMHESAADNKFIGQGEKEESISSIDETSEAKDEQVENFVQYTQTDSFSEYEITLPFTKSKPVVRISFEEAVEMKNNENVSSKLTEDAFEDKNELTKSPMQSNYFSKNETLSFIKSKPIIEILYGEVVGMKNNTNVSKKLTEDASEETEQTKNLIQPLQSKYFSENEKILPFKLKPVIKSSSVEVVEMKNNSEVPKKTKLIIKFAKEKRNGRKKRKKTSNLQFLFDGFVYGFLCAFLLIVLLMKIEYKK